jgi:hypothetical protein
MAETFAKHRVCRRRKQGDNDPEVQAIDVFLTDEFALKRHVPDISLMQSFTLWLSAIDAST